MNTIEQDIRINFTVGNIIKTTGIQLVKAKQFENSSSGTNPLDLVNNELLTLINELLTLIGECTILDFAYDYEG